MLSLPGSKQIKGTVSLVLHSWLSEALFASRHSCLQLRQCHLSHKELSGSSLAEGKTSYLLLGWEGSFMPLWVVGGVLGTEFLLNPTCLSNFDVFLDHLGILFRYQP